MAPVVSSLATWSCEMFACKLTTGAVSPCVARPAAGKGVVVFTGEVGEVVERLECSAVTSDSCLVSFVGVVSHGLRGGCAAACHVSVELVTDGAASRTPGSTSQGLGRGVTAAKLVALFSAICGARVLDALTVVVDRVVSGPVPGGTDSVFDNTGVGVGVLASDRAGFARIAGVVEVLLNAAVS